MLTHVGTRSLPGCWRLRHGLQHQRQVRCGLHQLGAQHHLQPLDATLGVPGLPQSGTGQATLWSGVNVAARIQDRSRDGRYSCVLVSETAVQEFLQRRGGEGLEAGFEFEHFGDETLKGKTQTIKIMELKNRPGD